MIALRTIAILGGRILVSLGGFAYLLFCAFAPETMSPHSRKSVRRAARDVITRISRTRARSRLGL
jgi:hypothetical protein